MSTQKAKFELFRRLQDMGFTYEEAVSLRRIEMTLQRWAEAECGDDSGTAIERDEKTDVPYRTWDTGQNGKRGRRRIADREAGALRRLGAIMARHPSYAAYHQGDCRGCMLYIVHKPGLYENAEELRKWVAENYTRGLAVCT